MKHIERLAVMMLLVEKKITQKEAGHRLGISDRQIRRIYQRFKSQGSQGLEPQYCTAHNPRNNKHSTATKDQCLENIQSRYNDKWS